MASAQVNGYRPAVAEQDVQSAFYDRWLQLRETVLADKHAHFKLPAAVRQRLQPQTGPSSTASYASTSQLPGLFNASSSEQTMRNPSHGAADAARLGNAQAFLQNTSTATGTTVTKSGIDPVLLTKSEDLIRAETQLKRQRIERQLKDTADQRRHTPFFKNQEDMAPLYGLTETFEKALELVKPISGLKPPANAHTAASDSFDENSYYSSQANDWSSEEGSPKKKATGPASSAPLSKQHLVGIELDDKQLQHVQTLEHHDTEALYDAEREDSEEYSPPDANAFSGPDADADAMDLDDGKWHIQQPSVIQLSDDADSSEFVPQEAHVASPQAPVVNSHLSQLAAPQPARVSPLTLAKPPGLTQSQTSYPSAPVSQLPASPYAYQSSSAFRQQFESDDSTTSPRNSTQTSPVGAFKKQRGKGKKRKREADREAREARKSRLKPSAPSPEPYIKPEPVSPPPFAAPAALQPSRTRPYQMPPDVEIVPSPRQAYYQEPPPPHPPTAHYGMDAVSSPTVIRVSSPAGHARPRRADQDLRRVASLHAAHRPMSPTARISSPAGYRTVSQPFPERAPRYGEEVMRTPQVQYMRSERSVTPPHLRAASMMAPPPPPPPARRIVVDQYGHRYYANEPEAQLRMSVAPQLRPESEMMYERAPSRQSVVYASQPAQSVYEDEHGMRMPPPPPPPMRRVVEQAEGAPTDYRAYRQREYSRAPEPQYYREDAVGPVYIRDAPGPRASVYPPEPATPVGYAPRAYSVHPEMEPVRYMSRQPSMAPQADYVRVAETRGRASTMAPPPAPMRAVSVVPGPEYGQAVEMRYSYGSQGAGGYAAAGPRYGEEAAPREIYVDQYGREVRRVGY